PRRQHDGGYGIPDRRAAIVVAALARRKPCRGADVVPKDSEIGDDRRLSRRPSAARGARRGLRGPALRARRRRPDGTARVGGAGEQVRRDLVAGRPPDRLPREHGRDAPALDAAGARRRAPPAHFRSRAHAPSLVLPRRAVDLPPAGPPEHLACAHGRRSSRAGDALPGVGTLPGGADPVARRPHPRLRALDQRLVAVAAEAGWRAVSHTSSRAGPLLAAAIAAPSGPAGATATRTVARAPRRWPPRGGPCAPRGPWSRRREMPDSPLRPPSSGSSPRP